MNVFEIIKENPDSLINKVINYDYGGKEKIDITVNDIKKTKHLYNIDDNIVEGFIYSISENLISYYVVSSNNCKIKE